MTIRKARERVLEEHTRYMTGAELFSAVRFIAHAQTLKELCDVLDVEHLAQQLKQLNK